MRETEIAKYPAGIAVRDNFLHGFVATIFVSVIATVGFLLVLSTAPKGIEGYNGMLIAVAVAFSVYALHKLVSRNMARNERNRLQLSQLIRSSARTELTALVSLDDADRIARGRVVRLYGYNVWLKKTGSTVTLTTDKLIGIRLYQTF